jgi:putative PEP-CTERM system histidine kinase
VLHRQEFVRAVVKFTSETFDALTVTLWQADAANGKLAFAASTSMAAADASGVPVAGEVYHALHARAGDMAQPVNIDRSREKWCAFLRESNPMQFPKGGHRFAMPLVSSGELVGLLVLGDRVGGAAFLAEDLDLLKCLADQIAAGLRDRMLSEKLVRAKEMEAFQTMSAFLVHDLKNTASSLSLTLRNLPAHFDNPEFRQDALRALSKSVERVNELISRFTTLRRAVELQRDPADLNTVVASALETVGSNPGINVRQSCQPLPNLLIDVRQIESAIVNLVLNAREAIVNHGDIRIETSRQNGEAILAISDDGCGMTPEFVSNFLFQPFKTSKKHGLGIGMFQTKAIIEAHGGRIAVQSEPGKGTTFRVWLPISIDAEKDDL